MLWIGPIERTAGIHGKAALQAWAASYGMMRAMQAGQAVRPTAQYLLMRQAAYMRPRGAGGSTRQQGCWRHTRLSIGSSSHEASEGVEGVVDAEVGCF